jgi:hypothetical protein
MSFFFFFKIEKQEGRTDLSVGVGFGTIGKREVGGKGCGKVNIVQILCTHVYKWKKGYLMKLFQE